MQTSVQEAARLGRGRSRRLRRAGAETGASLVLVLIVMIFIGVIVSSLIGYAATTLRSSQSFTDARDRRYAADAALTAAIAWAAENPKVGTDPALAVANAEPCYYEVPASGGQPPVVVTCASETGSGLGRPVDLGQVPNQAILTLGSRNNLPPPFNAGDYCLQNVPVIGPLLDVGDLGFARREQGIRLLKRKDPILGCVNIGPYQEMKINGNVYSNNGIEFEGSSKLVTTGAGQSIVTHGPCDGCSAPLGTVTANLTPTDIDPAGSTNLGGGNDPRSRFYEQNDPTYFNSFRQGALPDGPPRDVPGTCPAPAAPGLPPLVVFTPGYYKSAADLNDLFSDPTCKNAVFWFQPYLGDDGVVGGSGDDADTQGVYYFEFQDANDPYGCAEQGANPATAARWCVGTANDFDQKVIGGTPFGWDPTLLANGQGGSGGGPSTDILSLSEAGQIGLVQFWDNSDRVKVLDGSYAHHGTLLSFDRAITLGDFKPKVPEGTYSGAQLDIAYYVTNGTDFGGLGNGRINAPTLTIRTNAVTGEGTTCKTVTLPRRTSPGIETVDVSDCLTSGARANSLELELKASGCTVACTGRFYFDGVKVRLNAIGGVPSFPSGEPGILPDGTYDPGGDCDTSKAGVQFILGGASHIRVADGSMELCAGTGADSDQQIAIWGQAAPTPLRPGPAYPIKVINGPTVTAEGAKVKVIGESDQPEPADRRVPIQYKMSDARRAECQRASLIPLVIPPIHCPENIEGRVGMDFPEWVPPVDAAVDFANGKLAVGAVKVRASYDTLPNNAGDQIINGLFQYKGRPELVVRNLAGTELCRKSYRTSYDRLGGDDGFENFFNQFSYSGETWDEVDVSRADNGNPCVTAPVLRQGFKVEFAFKTTVWCTFGFCPGLLSPGTVTDHLDGVEVNVELKQADPNTADPVPAPASGCTQGYPNYYNGDAGSDCALVRASANSTVDIPFIASSANQSQGRLSVKGTIYAPTHAFDIDDFGIRYPLFSRGLIARTLMFRRVGAGTTTPLAGTVLDKTPTPREATFKACIRTGSYTPTSVPPGTDWECGTRPGDRVLSVARVRYEVVGPAIPNPYDPPRSAKPKILWWTSERD